MHIDHAKKLAQTLVDCFGNVEEAHQGYKRVMQNNCTFHDFEKLLAEPICPTNDERRVAPLSDVYCIGAHRDHVADLPEAFLKRLLNTFIDKSYHNDECASFTRLHADGDKAYHLWIDAKDQRDRCEESEFRFVFALASVSSGYDKNDEVDFIGYLNIGDNTWEYVFSDLDELTNAIEEVLPSF